MKRTKSSKRWLQEHFSDPYVKLSQQQGYRSRAVFKLQEIQEKDKLIKSGMTIVDLGAAPGGWTQYVSKLLKGTGKIFALDILPMEPLPDVTFFLGDFQEQKILDALLLALGEANCDLVLSDMAPNTSGIRESDQAKAMYLAELALDCAKKILKRGGCFVVKIFQGPGVDEFIRMLRTEFQSVAIRKPKASRPRSKEVYLVAKGYDL